MFRKKQTLSARSFSTCGWCQKGPVSALPPPPSGKKLFLEHVPVVKRRQTIAILFHRKQKYWGNLSEWFFGDLMKFHVARGIVQYEQHLNKVEQNLKMQNLKKNGRYCLKKFAFFPKCFARNHCFQQYKFIWNFKSRNIVSTSSTYHRIRKKFLCSSRKISLEVFLLNFCFYKVT